MTFNFLGPGLTVNVEAKVKEQIILDSSGHKKIIYLRRPYMKNARWVRLADDLTRGITNGDYPLDSYLPTEMELCEKYNVSRYTVRLALADLTRMGLIKRWPRLGSKVVSVGFDETYAHTYTSFADIDGLSSTHKRVVQGTQECVVDHALAKRLECERYLRFLRFSNVRTNPTDNGKPVVWTAVYVNAAYSRLPDLARLNPLVLLSTLIEKEYGEKCLEVVQKISAVPLPAEAAMYLDAQVGSPCLRILRHYMGIKRNILEISESYHPGDRYALTMNMRANR